MKYYLLCMLLAALSVKNISSAQPLDAASMKTILSDGNKPILNAIDKQTKMLNQRDSITAANLAKIKPTVNPGSTTIQDVITFLPVAFFLFLILLIFIKLRKDGIKLSDILIDKETKQERIKSNAAVAVAAVNAGQPVTSAAQASTESTDAPEQSTSRLIAFICGITSIALACCIASFYFYKSFTGTEKVDLGSLTNVLYGLGLGVLPYGFNKIAAALK